MYSSTTINDALLLLDKGSTWVRMGAIEAISPRRNSITGAVTTDTLIHLSGGGQLVVEAPVDDVMKKIRSATPAKAT